MIKRYFKIELGDNNAAFLWRPRKIGNILVLPWKDFCDMLWNGDLI